MKSIMQDTKECFLCRIEAGAEVELPDYGLELHHIMNGVANRKLSDQYGLTIWLCPEHHRTADWAVHRNAGTMRRIKAMGQDRFERIHGHEKWMAVFGKNYI